MSHCLIVSPSGNFYGSEQVLFDYLSLSQNTYEVWAPREGILFEKLTKTAGRHQIKAYNPSYLPLFYGKIGLWLLLGRVQTVYINEAGHVRYLIALSKIFKRRKFIVHVRILEDTQTNRWSGAIPENMTVISVSRYIQQALPVQSILLYDCYRFEDSNEWRTDLPAGAPLRIGVIGRITRTKGLDHLLQVLRHLEKKKHLQAFRFLLFGDISEDPADHLEIQSLKQYETVQFMGFESDKSRLYTSLDCLFHCSRQESLGRIFLEAIQYGKPLVGFNAAGIGEIGTMTNLSQNLVNFEDSDWVERVIQAFLSIHEEYKAHVSAVALAKIEATKRFNPEQYVGVLDKLLMQ